MKPVATQPQVGGQKCGDGTGTRPRRHSRAAVIAAAAGIVLLVAWGGCSQRPIAAAPGQPGTASSSGLPVQPQPGQPGGDNTPLANTTPIDRQSGGVGITATGADWLAALGALFAPFITPGTPGTFVGNAAKALG